MVNFISKIVKKLYEILKRKNITPKRIWKIICGTGVATIIAILKITNDYFDLASLFISKPDVDIIEAVSIDYLEAKGFDVENIYMLFEDSLVKNEEYFFDTKCATNISISNHYDESILVKNIVFEAQEIVEDNTPYLQISADMVEGENNKIYLEIINVGWGKLKEATLRIRGDNMDLDTYFQKDVYEVEVPEIEARESVLVPFLDISDLKDNNFSEDESILVSMEAFLEKSSDMGTKIINQKICVRVYADALKMEYPGDGVDDLVYGVKIDTKEKSFIKKEAILEKVPGNDVLTIPICIYPNRACKMKFIIRFDIWYKGKKKKVKSDSRTMTFFVDSIYGEQIINDAEEHTKSELTEWIRDDSETVAASYPYVDLDINRKKNPELDSR